MNKKIISLFIKKISWEVLKTFKIGEVIGGGGKIFLQPVFLQMSNSETVFFFNSVFDINLTAFKIY